MDCSLPVSSVHGIFQARILEWVATPPSRGSLDPGIEPTSPVSLALQADSLLLSNWGTKLTTTMSVQFTHSAMSNFVIPWTAAYQVFLSITNSWSLLKLMSIESVMPPNHFILCYSLLLPPLIFPSIRVFSKESVLCIRWPKYWVFSLSISPSNENSGLISFWIDWFDSFAVQWTLKSLLQNHSSKTSILWCSAFFIVQLLHPYMTTGKTIVLTRWTVIGKMMSLLFNELSSLVILCFQGASVF